MPFISVSICVKTWCQFPSFGFQVHFAIRVYCLSMIGWCISITWWIKIRISKLTLITTISSIISSLILTIIIRLMTRIPTISRIVWLLMVSSIIRIVLRMCLWMLRIWLSVLLINWGRAWLHSLMAYLYLVLYFLICELGSNFIF